MSGTASFEDLFRGEDNREFFGGYPESPDDIDEDTNQMGGVKLMESSVTVPLETAHSGKNLDKSDTKNFKVRASDKVSKKPGRKPDVEEPANKRKAQNRAAQRAFRERKERHLKDLEDRVAQLEHEAVATSDENEFLKFQVERLQDELKKYRSVKPQKPIAAATSSGSSPSSVELPGPNKRTLSSSSSKSFTFEFPFFQDANKVQSSPLSQASPLNQASSSTPSSVATSSISPGYSASSSVTPASIKEEPKEFAQNSYTMPNKNLGDTEEFCDQLSLACGNKNDPVPKSRASQVKEKSPFIQAGVLKWPVSPPINNAATSPAASKSRTMSSGSNAPEDPTGTTPSSLFSPNTFTSDFLNDYKDPLFDGDAFTLPVVTGNEYGMFDPLDNPVINESFDKLAEANRQCGLELDPTGGNKKSTLSDAKDEDEIPNNTASFMSCSDAWDRISSHPKFNDIDIDGLCFELRAKAKCADSGVLLSQEDLDHALNQTVKATEEAMKSRRAQS